MDDLAAAFSGAFNVTNTPNNTAAAHPRLTQYKIKSDRGSQEDRRLIRLDNQKKKREDLANHARRLAEDDWKGLEEDGGLEDEDTPEQMDSSTSKKRRPKRRDYYKDQLMMSEWLVDVPIDLSMEWLMVLCPAAKRTLVIASQGKTVAYNKAGRFLNTFPSYLPGGARHDRRRTFDSKYTILDCLYSDITRTYYVLDLMCWNGHPVYDSETEFRFYWMHTKFSEEPRLANKSKLNPFIFTPLQSYSCEASSITDTMSKPIPFQLALDGILFYHKRTHYSLGSTPLVGWLKPWMIPDMLGVPVPETIMAAKPPGADLRPPPPTNTMDTDSAKDKTPKGAEDKPKSVHHSGGKKGGRGDRKSGGHSMDMDEPESQPKSPVYKYEADSSSKQQNGNTSTEEKKEGKKEESMDGVG